MNTKAKQILQTIFFLLIGIFLVYMQLKTLSSQEKETILESLRGAHWEFIILAMAVSLGSHFFRAKRWRLLINNEQYSTSTTHSFYAVMIGYLANGFLPRLGEVIRCGVLSKKERIPLGRVLGTVFAERSFDLLVLILIVLLTIFLQFNLLYRFLAEHMFSPLIQSLQLHSSTYIIGAISLLLVLIIVVFVLGSVIKNISKKLYRKWIQVKHNFIEGFTTIFTNKHKGAFIFYTISMWFCYFLMAYIVFFALDESSHLSANAGLSVLTSGSLALIIPTPGGLGSYHAFVSQTLQLYSLPFSVGVTLSWLIWSTNFIVILIFGLLSLLLINFYPDSKRI